jgi:hypothetical protein
MTKIGNPAFDLVDVNLFSADFMPTMPFEVSRIIMPNHALVLDQTSGDTGFGPRMAHAPPYDTELSDGIAAAGFKTGMVYDRIDFSRGVGLAFMQIPKGSSPLGKTPDYESGPALALNTYPYTVSISVLFEGQQIVVDDRSSEPYPETAGTLVYEDGSPITYAALLESHLPTTARSVHRSTHPPSSSWGTTNIECAFWMRAATAGSSLHPFLLFRNQGSSPY